ncbi:MAG: PDZ domain-containing protein [Candidatus Falkowbacteria bacterium]|nr:PDZ domain-containing protein [Candidatus Falkowbacteria bacterium]
MKLEPDKTENGKGWSRVGTTLLLLIMVLLSFQAGLFYGAHDSIFKKAISNEAIYLGKVVGLYSPTVPVVINQDVNFKMFWEVWDVLKQDFVDKDKLNDKKLFYGALRGLVASLGDPYTVFMDPVVNKEFENDLSGTFEGIGAEIGIKDDTLTIIAPLPDMPAEKAGLKAGDKIYAINGTSTTGMSVDQGVNLIRGPKGTQVKLSIYRNGFKELKDFVVTRDAIIVKSVKTSLRPDGIYIITVSNFNNDTLDLFNTAVRDIVAKNRRRGSRD